MWIIRNKIFLAAISLTISLVVTFVLIPNYETHLNKTEDVIFLTHNISKNQQISKNMITVKAVSTRFAPSNACKSLDEVIGKYAKIDMIANDFITSEKIIEHRAGPSVNNLSTKQVAIAITMSSLSSSIAGQIKENDKVDIIAYDRKANTVIYDSGLTNILVSEVINSNGLNVNKTQKKNINNSFNFQVNSTPSSVVVICSIEQAKRLVELENTCKIHLVLKNRD